MGSVSRGWSSRALFAALLLLAAAPTYLAACGGGDSPAGGDTGPADLGDLGDTIEDGEVTRDGGGDSGGGDVDVTGDWLLLRYDLADAASAVPGQPDVSETRFEQRGATFTQFFGAADTEGISGTIEDGVYVQSDGTFTARNMFPDANHGEGTFEAGEFAMSFAFVRVGEPDHDVVGNWVADETEPVAVALDGDEITVELDGETLLGRIARDTAFLVAETPPENGALAAIVTWTSDEDGTLVVHQTSWVPDGEGHTAYSQERTSYTLMRPGAVVSCTADSECAATEECVERECIDRTEGSTCRDDASCPGDLYCARGLCQDGTTGDLCRDDDDCLAAEDLCDAECRPREPGDDCGPGAVCPGGLYCADGGCWAGDTGDPCLSTNECAEVTDACEGDPAVCTEVLVLIDPEPTLLGSPPTDPDRDPSIERQREVTLTRAFLIDPYETTRARFEALMGFDPSADDGCTSDDCPVGNVSAMLAMAYANARSEAEGLPPCYELVSCSDPADPDSCGDYAATSRSRREDDCVGYRLPTAAEWEIAARAGTATATYAGDHSELGCDDPALDEIAWHCGNSEGRSHPVGTREPNAWGLYDMIGNQWEWTSTPPTYPFGTPELDPYPAPGSVHVIRGGAYDSNAWALRAPHQQEVPLLLAMPSTGLRLVRTAPGQYGQPCEADSACGDGLYCGQRVCQDGRGGDYCGSGPCQSGVCGDVPAGTEPSRSAPLGPPRCAPEGMVLVPGADSHMGSPPGELGREASGLDEDPFTSWEPVFLWVSETEVTQGEWRALVGTNPSEFPACGDECPVENLSWVDAVAYANARSLAEGLTPCYDLGACDGLPGENPQCEPARRVARRGLFFCDGYRLPSEAEWEMVARAGSETATYLGDLTAADCRDRTVGAGAWFCGNSGGLTHPVAGKAPNANGLYDVLGNAAEWVGDWAAEYPAGPALGWSGPSSGSERVLRGGSFASSADRLRSASRESGAPTVARSGAGLRLVREAALAGSPCTPYVEASGCLEGMGCAPFRARSMDGSARGYCTEVYREGPEPSEACDRLSERCRGGSWCAVDLAYCAPYCDPEAADGEPGVCDDSSICRETGFGTGCVDLCDPFESFPDGGCGSGRWCRPDPTAETGGVCTASAGTSPQGELCSADPDCAPGHECRLGTCARYCDPAVAGTCGAGRTCVAAPAEPGSRELQDFGRCLLTCDYDRGVACGAPEDLCFPGELARLPSDVCVRIGSGIFGEAVPLESLEDCEEAGLREGDFCDSNSYCRWYAAGASRCTALCRTALAAPGTGYHPDCDSPVDRCGALGDERVGVCLRPCDFAASVLLTTSFDGAEGGLFGDASIEGWADGNYPTFADDESEGGVDGDVGLALHGWVEGGSGGWYGNFAAPEVGTTVTASANFHVEPSFDPDVFELKIEWWDGLDEPVGSATLDLLPLLTPATDATDEHEWYRVETQMPTPWVAVRGTAVIYFSGTSDAGVLQAARVDDLYVTTCR